MSIHNSALTWNIGSRVVGPLTAGTNNAEKGLSPEINLLLLKSTSVSGEVCTSLPVR